jgi:hypothetical protein
MPRRGIAPAAFVIAVTVVIWTVSGVSPIDIGKFVGYEIGFVFLPGAALVWAVRGRRHGLLLTIALGWPLGQALEILAFDATAAVGSRGLFVIYPIVVVVPCVLLVWRRWSPASDEVGRERLSSPLLWTGAAAMSLGLVYIAAAFIPLVPLPSTTTAVAYVPDFTHFISLVAEAKNHWPATSPGLSGYPLPYEWFVFDHMAAVSQVTGVSIPTIALRLDFIPTLLVLGCQLLVVGRLIGRSPWTGVLAIIVAFLLGPLDLTQDLLGQRPFFDEFNFHLWASWTFPFGLIFLLALLYLLAERLRAASWRSGQDFGAWVLVALLMIGASGAKATVLPIVITGTALYGALDIWRKRAININALVAIVLGIVIFAATFLIVYGGGVPGTEIDPLAFLNRTVPETVAANISNHVVRDLARLIGYAIAFAGLLLPLVGALYLLRRRHRAEMPQFTLCLCFLAAGVLIANVVHQIGFSEEYFLDTGYVAGTIVAAAGLRMAWLDLGGDIPISVRAAGVAFLAWLALVAAAVVVISPSLAHPAGLLLRYGAIAAAAVIFVLVSAFVLRRHRPPRAGLIAIGLIPLLAISALDAPVERAPIAERVLTGQPITVTAADPHTVRGLTPGLLVALNWLRENTPTDTILAVSNHWTDPGQTDGRYFYYSAFAEREVFVEAYNPEYYGLDNPPLTPAFEAFLHRVMLSDAVFDHADEAALRVMIDHYGVRYLLIDRLHHNADPAVLQLGRVVFTNQDATIVAVG